MSEWIGRGVSVSCGSPLGCYQGTIIQADGETITLNRAFRNGFPYPKKEVTLKASDIRGIEIIDANATPPDDKKQHSTIKVTKPNKKGQNPPPDKSRKVFTMTDALEGGGGGFSQSLPCAGRQGGAGRGAGSNSNGYQLGNTRSKPIDIQGKNNRQNTGGGHMGSTPNKKDKQRRRNEACFGTPSDDPLLNQDFDFEKNLALFDKQALWEELNQAQKPDVVRQTDMRRNPSQQKFRHDENILGSHPIAHRAITVPQHGRGPLEYVTDDGLVIPSLTPEFRLSLLSVCGNMGLNGAELMGRAGAEVALQLLGGSRRLHPANLHQVPTVAVLVGAHRQGVLGVTCARHLACQGVTTVVVVAGVDLQAALQPHLNLYQLTKNKITTNILEVPPVDLIILALCEDMAPVAHPHLAEWASRSRAPVLALDPPPGGTPEFSTRYSLVPILPLSHSADNGKLYLCNLAVPDKIFTDLDIKYSSPFGSKFVIALHPSDS